ncbi:hypothetical protein EW146_g8783 [Bondarzewia mesenterica]|uniref:Uncharacterized protein n=1 Tax=Bondarzewia mesenterica TaxID=1095465 RepID=A0A4S4LC52_9AGAM|nr:hypothetical protein EW146_g8783 [Bondarzewia mesenterica]
MCFDPPQVLKVPTMSQGAALITGAAQGIGKSIALRLAEDGYDVVINDISAKSDGLAAVQAEIAQRCPDRRCIISTGDISLEDDVRRVFKATIDDLGSLDVMVANAGICSADSFMNSSVEDLDNMYSVNLRGVFLCQFPLPRSSDHCEKRHGTGYQYAARRMIEQGRGGRIIGASSGAGKQGLCDQFDDAIP